MYKQCITQPAILRQRQLENHLLQMMLHHDYESINISDFCDSIGIPRKSFYRYFSNKDGALYALVDHALQDFINEFFSCEDTVSFEAGERFFQYWLTKKDLLHALERNNLGGVLVQRTIEMTVTDDRFLHHILPDSLRHMQNYMNLFLVSGIMSLLIQWQKDDFKASPREMSVISGHILNRSAFMK